MPDRFGKYSYFDTPDGVDVHKKAWYLCKYFAKLSLITATNEAFAAGKYKLPVAVLTTYGRHFTILVGTGLTFVCATYISTDLRGVDDARNHAFGAVCASAVFGAAISSPMWGAALALTFTPFLHANKTAIMNGDNVWRLHKVAKEFKREYPTAYWHTVEAYRRPTTLKDMYEVKNEEYYRTRETEV